MIISLIAAMSENSPHVIGRDNRLPWRLPADLKRFKELTIGHTVIMGRRTFESMNGALPQRRNVVITRNRDFQATGADVVHSLDDALSLAADEEEVFILGGEDIFRLALPRANRMYITMVHAHIDGDTYFPDFDDRDWKLASDERHDADERNSYAYSFRVYERVR